MNLIFRKNRCLADTGSELSGYFGTDQSRMGGGNSSLKSFADSLFPSGKILSISVSFILFFLSASFQPLAAQDRTMNAGNSIAAFDPEWLGVYYGLPSGSIIHTQPACPDCPDSSRTHTKCPLPEEPDDSLSKTSSALSLLANLLRWATLTPDLGIEWRISQSVGVMVNGSWTSWSWNNAARRYALWEVAGQFNYKFSGTGRQGDLLGGGITGGYQLRLNKALALDFTLGLGYLNADTERYDVIDGVRVRSGNETKHWIGPVNAGVTLMWRLF